MGELFNTDNSFWQAVGKAGDLILLTLLAVFASLPLVTLGASLSALYYTAFKILEDDNQSTVRNFFHSFRQNLVQGMVISIIVLVLGGLLFFDVRFMLILTAGSAASGLSMPLLCAGWVICVFLGILFLFLVLYLFPLQARFFNPLSVTLKNALAAGIRYLPKTLQMAVGDGAFLIFIWLCFENLVQIVIIPLLLAPSLLALYNAWVLRDLLGLTPGKRDLPVEDPD
ncbi:MAG TPA: YesL family protein [Candidatus Copromonas faecavium]|uniref:YesL family protein n=1 Tax=Candidatus Copromonas faecavium (nom. illeg.) TaxID=2840740 RepID=A0A9D1A2N8_9FIRM|nr:YesL family protein [Candidatus Copromonas faecavium]